MRDKSSAKTISDIILLWVTVISLMLGGLWAILEYKDRQKSAITDKAYEVLKYVQRYNSDPIQKYREDKIKVFAESYRALYLETGNWRPDNPIAFAKETVDKNKLRFEIDNITFFYDELYVCVKTDICDEEIAHSFFGKHAFDFMRGLHKYMDFVRDRRNERGVSGYAEGLKYFEKAYSKKEQEKRDTK